MKIFGKSRAFTLLEVVLAVGVLGLALLTLAGLLARSTGNLVETKSQNKAEALAGKLDAFLQEKGFDTVYSWVAGDSEKVLFFYSLQSDSGLEGGDLNVRETSYPGLSDEIADSIGPVLKIILKSSPLTFRESGVDGIARTLPASPDDFAEGYLAVEAWVYSETGVGPEAELDIGPAVRSEDFITVYNYAVTRGRSL